MFLVVGASCATVHNIQIKNPEIVLDLRVKLGVMALFYIFAILFFSNKEQMVTHTKEFGFLTNIEVIA